MILLSPEAENALRSSLRKITYKYELLNRHDHPIGEVDVLSASIDHNEFSAVKRIARFLLPEKHVKEDIQYEVW